MENLHLKIFKKLANLALFFNPEGDFVARRRVAGKLFRGDARDGNEEGVKSFGSTVAREVEGLGFCIRF